MPTAPLAVLAPASGGGAPTAPSVVLAAASGGGAPTAPLVVLAAASGGGAPSSPLVVLAAASGGGAPTAPLVVLAAASGGGSPTSPLLVLAAAAGGGGSVATVSGSLTSDGSTPLVFPELVYSGELGGKPSWSDSGDWDTAESGLAWFEGTWRLTQYPFVGGWESAEDVATPDLVTAWDLVGTATGDPEISIAGEILESPGAVLPAADTANAPAAPAPVLGMPLTALYNTEWSPLLNTDDTILTGTDA